MSNGEPVQSQSRLGENGFPKITGKVKDFLHQLQKLKDQQKLPDVVPIIGTVELHGMHVDIVYNLHETTNQSSKLTNTVTATITTTTSDGPEHPDLKGITFQTRNTILPAQSSLHGYPTLLSQHPSALHYLKTRILQTYLTHHPGATINRLCPLIISGEWIGSSVQPAPIGLSHLSPRFVILAVKLNGTYLPDSLWSNIEANKAGVYSLHRVPPFVVHFHTDDLSVWNYALRDMQAISDDVESCCPYATHFGVDPASARGEGVVWKIGTEDGIVNPKCWFKMKGPLSWPENRITETSITHITDKKAAIENAVRQWVSDRRVEQGFEYLLEIGTTPDGKDGVKKFVEWVVADVLLEEGAEIEVLKEMFVGDEGVRREVKSRIGRVARERYFEEMRKAVGGSEPL